MPTPRKCSVDGIPEIYFHHLYLQFTRHDGIRTQPSMQFARLLKHLPTVVCKQETLLCFGCYTYSHISRKLSYHVVENILQPNQPLCSLVALDHLQLAVLIEMWTSILVAEYPGEGMVSDVLSDCIHRPL